MSTVIDKKTVERFDVAGPRYTSYPTAPVWSPDVSETNYIEKLRLFGKSDKTLSLYIHVPFCQSMCTYCACNVVIRRQDEKYGDQYIDHLEKEAELLANYIGARKPIKQFHWGGGTPTFLNETQIKRLFDIINTYFDIDLDGEVAIEIDPRTIDCHKVKYLREIGFNRISMGIQDFAEEVQQSINRVQPFDQVREIFEYCRTLGFVSINFDLIYGLPNQTPSSFEQTVKKVVELKPDRIALYSFAFVPWLKKHQNKIDPDTLPNNDKKLEIFLNAREMFLANGYDAIAMDHFALKEDELAQAFRKDKLYRNFMGYTVKPADEYIGMGVTAIGFLENTYFQNEKILPRYYSLLEDNKLPIERGLELSEDDRIRQWTINSLMCHFRLDKRSFRSLFNKDFDRYFVDELQEIKNCEEEGLIRSQNDVIIVTELGKIFIRNVCMSFDKYLKDKTKPKRFSKTI